MDQDNEFDSGSRMRLDKSHLDGINAIIQNKIRISLDQEAIKEDVSALAQQLGMKPGKLNKLIGLIMKEQGKGGVIEEESELIMLAEQVLNGDV